MRGLGAAGSLSCHLFYHAPIMDIAEAKRLSLSKEGRKSCWAARDVFYACLDAQGAGAVAAAAAAGGKAVIPTKCASLRTEFETQCPASWVRHFDNRRRSLLYRRRLELGGFQETEEEGKE